MRFAWDDAKRDANLRKHRVRFEDAIKVFDDPHHIDVDATEDEYDEERRAATGRADPARLLVLKVIYTDRSADVRRIISARPADPWDANDYHSRFTDS